MLDGIHPTRRGMFRMTPEFIQMAIERGLNPMDRMIVLDIRTSWFGPWIEVCAYHPDFDEVKLGEITPEYEGIFVDGRRSPFWRRVS